MKVLTKGYHLLDIRWTLPVAGGMIIAVASAVILRHTYLWAALITVGLLVFVFSFMARNFRSYWLAIFALVLPLEIKKLLIDSEYVRAVINANGFSVGEIPAPVLYLSDLPFLVLMLYWLFEITFKKQKIFFPKSNWMALPFVAWAGLSVMKAPLFSYAFFDYLRLIKFYFIYLYIANNLRSKAEVKLLINFFLAGVIFQSLICLYQYVSQDVGYVFGNLFGQRDIFSQESMQKYQSYFSVSEAAVGTLKRASGTVGVSNIEAEYFEFLVPVAFMLWLTAKKFWSKIFYFAVFVLGSLGLFVTFSRGGLIGLMVGVFTVLFLSWMFKLVSNKKFLTILMIFLCIGTAMTPKIYQYIMSRPQAATARLHLLKVGLDIVNDHPITGVGLNNHLVVAPDYNPETYLLAMPTHNYYILIATEIGIPGLVFYLGFIAITYMIALRAARSEDLYIAALSMGIIGVFTAISVHTLVDWLASNTNQTLFWLHAGLAAALHRLNVVPSPQVAGENKKSQGK